MTENYGNLQPFIDRTSTEYIASAEENTYDGVTMGVYGGETPPNNFEELARAIESVADCGSDMRQDVETILGFISSLPNRDEIVRLLPYDPIDKHVTLALPASDFIKDRTVVEVPEKYNQSDQESFSRREILAHRLRNFGREIIGHHPIPITGPTANVVKVAGMDPFSPNPDEVHGEELFRRAREYEQDRKYLAGEI